VERERLGDLSLPSLPILQIPLFWPVINRMDGFMVTQNDIVAAYQVSWMLKYL